MKPWLDIDMNQFRPLWTKYVDYDMGLIRQCNFGAWKRSFKTTTMIWWKRQRTFGIVWWDPDPIRIRAHYGPDTQAIW